MKTKFPFLNLKTIEMYMPLIVDYKVSIQARKPNQFLDIYKTYGQQLPIKWMEKRENFIKPPLRGRNTVGTPKGRPRYCGDERNMVLLVEMLFKDTVLHLRGSNLVSSGVAKRVFYLPETLLSATARIRQGEAWKPCNRSLLENVALVLKEHPYSLC